MCGHCMQSIQWNSSAETIWEKVEEVNEVESKPNQTTFLSSTTCTPHGAQAQTKDPIPDNVNSMLPSVKFMHAPNYSTQLVEFVWKAVHNRAFVSLNNDGTPLPCQRPHPGRGYCHGGVGSATSQLDRGQCWGQDRQIGKFNSSQSKRSGPAVQSPDTVNQ
ncbi:hypothetical protein BaRGS_00002438 [Batillaria attramentaria]|uniref:Uncharacterized protein n=1 Tax=Batillaria attramentaria TaxID=370345 RepID=A0ABD0M4Q4_9CAEN